MRGKMKNKIILSLCVILLAVTGCKTWPFNPKADVKLLGFTDTSNVAISDADITGTPPFTIKASIGINNGIDMTFNNCVVEFFNPDGTQIAVTMINKMTYTIAGTGTTAVTAAGYVPLNITNADIVTYHNTTNITPITVSIRLSGIDANENAIEVKGSIPANF